MDLTAQPISTESRIFAHLDPSAIAQMLAKAVRASVRPYTQLCRAGEPIAWFYVVLQGEVKYCRPLDDGTEIVIRILSKNECFGMGTFGPTPQTYLGSAETITFCDILKWRAADILALAQSHPKIAQNALAIVLSYLAEYSNRHAALVAESSTARLARVLLDLANRTGTPRQDGIDVQVSNEDLGALADVSRFTVSRTMSRWQSRNVISKSRNHVILRVPEELMPRPKSAIAAVKQ